MHRKFVRKHARHRFAVFELNLLSLVKIKPLENSKISKFINSQRTTPQIQGSCRRNVI